MTPLAFTINVLCMTWFYIFVLLFWFLPNLIYIAGLSTKDEEVIAEAKELKKHTQTIMSYLLTFQRFNAAMMMMDWNYRIQRFTEKLSEYQDK